METRTVQVAPGVSLILDRWGSADPGAFAGDADRPRGELPAFLLVHGLASNARLWDAAAAALLARGYDVLAVDLRGHGRSSKPDGPYDVPTVADDLLRVIEALRLDRPVAAGQSWGGNVVLELAWRAPDAVRGIACVDGGWLEPSSVFRDWDACLAALAPPRLVGRPFDEVERYARSVHPDWPEAGIRGMLANFEVRPDGTVAPWLTYERHIEVLRGLWDHRPSTRYRDIRVPALLVPADSGQGDQIEGRRAVVAAAARAIPRSRVHWFVGDHDIHAQHPDELAGVLHAATMDGFFR